MDEDVLSRILLDVPDSKTVHAFLLAVPTSHPLFPAALYRLCQLLVCLDTYDARSAEASNAVLDLLLRSEAGPNRSQISQFIRHLVVATEHDKYWNAEQVELDTNGEGIGETEGAQQEPELTPKVDEQDHEEILDEETAESEPDIDVAAFHARLPHLFKKMQNLESLDYHHFPGLAMSTQIPSLLADHDRLCKFSVDGVMRRDARLWPRIRNIEPFLASLETSITSLDIRHVCQTMLLALASHADEVASYRCLKHLKMDITEGRGTGTADAHRWQAPPVTMSFLHSGSRQTSVLSSSWPISCSANRAQVLWISLITLY
ncbi:hypothetical protein DFH09DRAFT_1332532 [Mycena vulgaris]|nr:hypothetical protein DFH09DRAFT_1332532 [Mycena vulgaris]